MSRSVPYKEQIERENATVGIPFCRKIWGIMNKSLSAYVKVDGSCVWVNLVHKMVPMVDQVLLQIPKPKRVKLTTRKGDNGKTCSIRSQPTARCSLGWLCRPPED